MGTRQGLTFLAVAGAALAVMAATAAPEFVWRLPAGTKPPPVPADNPMTEVKVELGRRLFYDTRLSVDRSLSCASCHEQARGFANGGDTATIPGVGGVPGKRNPMGLSNVGYRQFLTWANPRMDGLELQVLTPIFGDHPVEMGMAGQEDELVRRLATDACYTRLFAAAFADDGGQITLAAAAKAIAAFERTLISYNSPYDRYVRGDKTALSPQALRGHKVFFDTGCAMCHRAPHFIDEQFHDIGLPKVTADRGMIDVTGRRDDANLFITTTLRNIAEGGPYMHDGSVATLEDTIVAHRKGTNRAMSITYSPVQTAELVAFMRALSDEQFLTDPKLGPPGQTCER